MSSTIPHGEATEWLLGVEKNGRVCWLCPDGTSKRVPIIFSGDFVAMYRESVRRMRAWQVLSGRVDYTVYARPVFAALSEVAQ